MEDRDYMIILYDYYQELFNDKQKECFEAYYFDNLSLSEIALNMDKSRNAIHKVIKNVCNKLSFYEDKLKLYDRNKLIKKIVKEYNNQELLDKLEDLL